MEELEVNWRRVASTHTLQDLLAEDHGCHVGPLDHKLQYQKSKAMRRRTTLLYYALLCLGIFFIVIGCCLMLLTPGYVYIASRGTADWLLVESSIKNYFRYGIIHRSLNFIQVDEHYHLCVPLLFPVTFLFIGLNWFSMKLFKHNSG